ncbi:uncharacterized protein LOC132551755 [Ylistrum balloti]|uniref:uncharacterized protein LOC132551755 n=1 Tax=Ylistrum balloti TaxID=509963 RepID=UPI0029059F80|nr:uncharacterized protein LOC132551755 [Ylistrum balloti]
MFTIEIKRIKSVTPYLDKKQFEVFTEKSFLFSAETLELCQDWINHIEEARQQDGELLITSQKPEKQPMSPRRGSLPQQNAVSNAMNQLSSKSVNESSSTKPTDRKIDRTSSTKDMINRFSGEITPKENVSSPSRPLRLNSGGKVNSLLTRFSGGGNSSPTSPVSPPLQSHLPPLKTSDRPASFSLTHHSSSNSSVQPLSVGNKPTDQKMPGITTTSTGTKIDLSQVSSVASEGVQGQTSNSAAEWHTDSGYTSGVCSSPPKDIIQAERSEDVCQTGGNSPDDNTDEPVRLRTKMLPNGDNHHNAVAASGIDADVEGEEDDEDSEQVGPNLQLLDELMNLTFEEIEVPQGSSVDLSSFTELKELLTDLPTSLMLQRSVDVNNQTAVEELSQFLKTVH